MSWNKFSEEPPKFIQKDYESPYMQDMPRATTSFTMHSYTFICINFIDDMIFPCEILKSYFNIHHAVASSMYALPEMPPGQEPLPNRFIPV